MFFLADILGTKDLIAIIFCGLVVVIVLFMGRRISINVRGVSASVEAAESAAKDAAAKAHEAGRKVDEARSDIKDTVGEKNGNGDAMTMLARSLANQVELLHWQERSIDLERELLKLHTYTHEGVHRLNGQVGMMWREWAIRHGVNPDDLPAPQASPSEDDPAGG